MKQYVKPVLAVFVLCLTITAFSYYFATHADARQQLTSTSPWLIGELLVLYGLTILSLIWIQSSTLRLCQTTLGKLENTLLTIYSSIVNFFGPLQSGPGFRAIYLKKKHGTKLKNYTLATLLYYAFYAAVSGLFLLSGLLGWKLLILLALGFIGATIVLTTRNPLHSRLNVLDLRSIYRLGLATLLQLSLVALIYFLELRSLDHTISLGQAVVYAGAANFALFVSVTPGAIGFRESFLLFSQNLHHIDNATILTASLIDRGVYVLLLGLLFVFVVSVHAKDKLQLKTADR